MLKNIDGKTIAILILAIALIVSFIIGQKKPNVDTHANEILELHKNNDALIRRNDSLMTVNVKINSDILNINKKLVKDSLELVNTKQLLKDLNKRQNEIHTYVNHLSANDVSSSFSDYIQQRTKSKNIR